jgi:hypothetical protein
VSTIFAPTDSKASSLKFESSPAPFSTYILNPDFINLDAASGDTETLFSPGKTSFGIPLILKLPIVKFLVSKEEKFYKRRPVYKFK